MQQTSLVDDVLIASTRSAVPVVGVVGSAATLTKSQMRFNKLVERLTLQRQELARWQAFGRPITSNWPITIRPRRTFVAESAVLMVRYRIDFRLNGCLLIAPGSERPLVP